MQSLHHFDSASLPVSGRFMNFANWLHLHAASVLFARFLLIFFWFRVAGHKRVLSLVSREGGDSEQDSDEPFEKAARIESTVGVATRTVLACSDLVGHIMQFISVREKLLAMSLVCKGWHYIINCGKFKAFSYLSLHGFEMDMDRLVLGVGLFNGNSISSICIHFDDEFLSIPHFTALLYLCPNLTALDIDFTPALLRVAEQMLPAGVVSVGGIRVDCESQFQDRFNATFEDFFRGHGSNLQHLCVNPVDTFATHQLSILDCVAIHCPSLRKLSAPLEPQSLPVFADKCQSINVLELSHPMGSPNDEHWSRSVVALRTMPLHSLELTALSGDALRSLFTGGVFESQQLVHFTLLDCRAITDDVVMDTFFKCPSHLTSVCFSRCSRLTPDIVDRIADLFSQSRSPCSRFSLLRFDDCFEYSSRCRPGFEVFALHDDGRSRTDVRSVASDAKSVLRIETTSSMRPAVMQMGRGV